MAQVLFLCGSPRVGGNTDECAAYVERKIAAAGHETQLVRVHDRHIEPCRGCRACMRVCQFGAIAYSAADKKAYVDQTACYGCGVCRSACAKEAIELKPRAEVPAVANHW